MWSWLLTSISILTISIIQIVRGKTFWEKCGFVLIGIMGLLSTYVSYQDNNELSEILGQINTVEAKIDSLIFRKDTLVSDINNLNHGVDSLLARREQVKGQLHLLHRQHDSLLLLNDSLLKLSKTQLSGVLTAQSWQSTLTDAGNYETVFIFRSKWAQDIQDISIVLQFNVEYLSAVIKQLSSSSFLNVSCRERQFVGPSNSLSYSCDYLFNGNFLQLIVLSKQPITLTEYDLRPRIKE